MLKLRGKQLVVIMAIAGLCYVANPIQLTSTPEELPPLPEVATLQSTPEIQAPADAHVESEEVKHALADISNQIYAFVLAEIQESIINQRQASHQRVKTTIDQTDRTCRLVTDSPEMAQFSHEIHASSHISFDEGTYMSGYTEVKVRVPTGKMELWRSDIEQGLNAALSFFQNELKLTVDTKLYVDLTVLESKDDYIDFAQKFGSDFYFAQNSAGMFSWGYNQVLVDGSYLKHLKHTVAHEMAHKLQQQLLGVMSPLIAEGVAEVAALSIDKSFKRRLPWFMDYDGLVNTDSAEWNRNLGTGNGSYALAEFFMNYLIYQHTDRALNLVKALAKKPCENLTVEEFEAIISPDGQFEIELTRHFALELIKQQQTTK